MTTKSMTDRHPKPAKQTNLALRNGILCAASGILIAGLVAPSFTVRPSLGNFWTDDIMRAIDPQRMLPKSHSILSSVRVLWAGGYYFLFLILALFSVVGPLLHLATAARPPSIARNAFADSVAHLTRMSMIDVFVFGVVLLALKDLPRGTTLSLEYGVLLLLAFPSLMWIASRIENRQYVSQMPEGIDRLQVQPVPGRASSLTTLALIGASSLLLIAGICGPSLELHPSTGSILIDEYLRDWQHSESIKTQRYSILGTVQLLFESGNVAGLLVGTFIFLFSVVFPICKLAVLYYAQISTHPTVRALAVWTSHWAYMSMLDVFVVIKLVVCFADFPANNRVYPCWGIVCFALSVLLSIVVARYAELRLGLTATPTVKEKKHEI